MHGVAPQPGGDDRHGLVRDRAAAAEPARAARRKEDRDELTILCFKERARKRKGDDFITDAHYLCCDTQVLHERVLDYFYGTQSLDAQTRAQQPAALALLASRHRAAAAATLSRSRACAPTSRCPWCATWCAAATPQALEAMACSLASGASTCASASRAVETVILEYAKSLEDVPRMQSAKAQRLELLRRAGVRALWTCAYWHQQELKDCSKWGFASMCG